ncbi:hypothetical protein DRJ17_02580 [Candidatus Woesearchaeota archaeon]|nr:MAG: hypothetical protein DRJ17_02580 [Candidatus Woesearchaeota archaeon]
MELSKEELFKIIVILIASEQRAITVRELSHEYQSIRDIIQKTNKEFSNLTNTEFLEQFNLRYEDTNFIYLQSKVRSLFDKVFRSIPLIEKGMKKQPFFLDGSGKEIWCDAWRIRRFKDINTLEKCINFGLNISNLTKRSNAEFFGPLRNVSTIYHKTKILLYLNESSGKSLKVGELCDRFSQDGISSDYRILYRIIKSINGFNGVITLDELVSKEERKAYRWVTQKTLDQIKLIGPLKVHPTRTRKVAEILYNSHLEDSTRLYNAQELTKMFNLKQAKNPSKTYSAMILRELRKQGLVEEISQRFYAKATLNSEGCLFTNNILLPLKSAVYGYEEGIEYIESFQPSKEQIELSLIRYALYKKQRLLSRKKRETTVKLK